MSRDNRQAGEASPKPEQTSAPMKELLKKIAEEVMLRRPQGTAVSFHSIPARFGGLGFLFRLDVLREVVGCVEAG